MAIECVKVHDLLRDDASVIGVAILVDRLWPRGVAKADLSYDEWLKDVAPSPTLRRWFDHDPAKFAEFRRRYWEELDAGNEDVDKLVKLGGGDLTLLYAAKDREYNHAVALATWLKGKI